MELLGPNSTPLPVVVEVPVMLTAPLLAIIGVMPQALPYKLPTAIPVVVKPVILILPLVAVKPPAKATEPPPPVVPPALTPLIVMAVPLRFPFTKTPYPPVVGRLVQPTSEALI